MNHAEANPDLTAVDAAIRQLITALDYPEHEIDNITILNNGIIRVATRDHAMRGVVTRAFSREAPKAVLVTVAPEIAEKIAEGDVGGLSIDGQDLESVVAVPTPNSLPTITVTKTPARAGAK